MNEQLSPALVLTNMYHRKVLYIMCMRSER